MAITPNTYNSVVFGGINSADYGIYITGEAVYNAPVRAVDFVSVPGRNGAVALDQGHYENVTVTYPAGTFGGDQQGFREALSDYRNAILSQIGYQRLSDTYHPDEYRLGIYADGLEVKPTNSQNGTAGEFDLTFNCKPQRYLTSGETAITVTSGGNLTNPTLFDAQPLLIVKGEGNIKIGEENIGILHRDLGLIKIADAKSVSGTGSTMTISQDFNGSLLNHGDMFGIVGFGFGLELTNVVSITPRTASGNFMLTARLDGNSLSYYNQRLTNMNYITQGSTDHPTRLYGEVTFNALLSDGTTKTATITSEGLLTEQDGVGNITITVDWSISSSLVQTGGWTISYDYLRGDSTAVSDDDVYIDLEIGEAYHIVSGHLFSLDSIVQIGGNLPVLAPGDTTITYDNTINSFKIKPRWWKI